MSLEGQIADNLLLSAGGRFEFGAFLFRSLIANSRALQYLVKYTRPTQGQSLGTQNEEII